MAAFTSRTITAIVSLLLISSVQILSQSRDQNFPTAITSNEVIGTINPRALGDSRLTTYFYEFAGTQGDIFINLVTKNYAGDIDVFTKEGLRPLTKIVVFDPGLNETGRLIYLRKEETLLLRIQGRTPNDSSAEFRIKFGGSFVALKPRKEVGEPMIESAKEDPRGTATAAKTEVKPKSGDPIANGTSLKGPGPPKAAEKPKVVITSTIDRPRKTDTPPAKAATPSSTLESIAPTARKADPLASIRLVIRMKDGSVIERPMSEVTRFNVDKGWLNVAFKGGTVSKYSLLDVERITIE